jgi:hypothetical protein
MSSNQIEFQREIMPVYQMITYKQQEEKNKQEAKSMSSNQRNKPKK